MTETELQEIEKRCAKASGGEWTSELARWDISSKRYQVVCNGSPICTMPTEGPGSRRNAAFIAHARQDVPALLSTVRELQRQVAELEADNKRLRAMALVKPIDEHDWEAVSVGEYDTAYRCQKCGKRHVESADNPLTERPDLGCHVIDAALNTETTG